MSVSSFYGAIAKLFGVHGGVVTPVPISNTVVKHSSGENTSNGKIARCQIFLFFY